MTETGPERRARGRAAPLPQRNRPGERRQVGGGRRAGPGPADRLSEVPGGASRVGRGRRGRAGGAGARGRPRRGLQGAGSQGPAGAGAGAPVSAAEVACSGKLL